MKIGFIGAGMMSQVGHLPFYLASPDCEVVAIAETRPSLVAALSAMPGHHPLVSDHQQIFADPMIDAVMISAPRPATGPLVLAALEAGKHVISEKPMAHTLEQAERLVTAAEALSLNFFVGFMKRYDPGVQLAREKLKKFRQTNELGSLLAARFYDFSAQYAVQPPNHVRPTESRLERFEEWPLAPDWLALSLRGAYAWYSNAISHDVNLVRFFFGDQLQVLGAAHPNQGAVTAILMCEDIVITLDAAKTSAGRWIEGAEFLFDKGRLAIEIPSPMDTLRRSTVVVEGGDPSIGSESLEVPPGWAFEIQAKAYIDALSGDGAVSTSGRDCLGDLVLIEQIWRRINERIVSL